MAKRTSRLDLADTRDRIRKLTRQRDLLSSKNALVNASTVSPSMEDVSAASQTVEELRSELAEAKRQVSLLSESLAEAQTVLKKLRGERARAKASVQQEPEELAEVRQELSTLWIQRNDQVKHLLMQGESASDVADFSGLSLPRIYQIRKGLGIGR